MKNLPLILSAVALLAAGAALVQNFGLKKKIEDTELALSQFKNDHNHSAPPSPFDNPSPDPLANTFNENKVDPNLPRTSIRFDREVHDFGKIKDGDKPKTKFKFTNTGKEPLIISNAQGSCGCTVPSYPKDPIPPGKTAEIEVEFDSSNKQGEQQKTVTITANTDPEQTILTVKSTVLPKE
jgi:hypothetical protein